MDPYFSQMTLYENECKDLGRYLNLALCFLFPILYINEKLRSELQT